VSGTSAQIEVLGNPAALAERAADWMTTLARKKRTAFSVALSGGSTPRCLYQSLAAKREFPWQGVHWFWGDERFVPHDDPMSNYRLAYESMLSKAPVQQSHIHAIPTEGLTAGESAALYESELQRFYGTRRLDPARFLFDVTLLGLGVDGHIASLFPGSLVLGERKRWTAAVAGQGQDRVTLTLPALESSAHVAFLVTGAEKRKVLRQLWQREGALPAALLHPIGELRFFVDASAAS
jgi:6-phosphogluconolactonase